MNTSLLIVDDNAEIRFLLREQLGSLFQTVHEAESAAGASEIFTSALIDVVVCDFMMPGGSGLDVYEQMLSSINSASYFILFTAAPELVPRNFADEVVVIDKLSHGELQEAVSWFLERLNLS